MKVDYSDIKRRVHEDRINANEMFDKRFLNEIDSIASEIAKAAKNEVRSAVEGFYRQGEVSYIDSKGLFSKRYYYSGGRDSYITSEGLIFKRYFYAAHLHHYPNKVTIRNDFQKGDYTIRYRPYGDYCEELRFRTLEQLHIFLSKTNTLLKEDRISINWGENSRIYVKAKLGKL